MSGLTFAIALAQSAPDIDVEIYEAAAVFTEVGAGMGMWPRIWEVMESLGLGDNLRSRTGSRLQGTVTHLSCHEYDLTCVNC